MKSILLLNLLLAILLFPSCTQPTGHSTQKPETIYAQSTWLPTKKESVVMIYDLDRQRKRLEYRAVKVKNSSGDPLSDLVNSFLINNSIEGARSDLSLRQLVEEDGKATFSFAGKAHFDNKQDSLLFWEALDITLAREYKNQRFAFEHF